MTPPPPRLDILLASESPVALVFRRGPSKVVRVIHWNRETDRFKPGSWFRGRIYVDRSELSPDGRHLIYFAMGGAAWAIPATRGTWTAISRMPSLKAIALWGQGDTWSGGGCFTSNSFYWLDSDDVTFLIRDNSGLRRDPETMCSRSGSWSKKQLPQGWILRRSSGRRPRYTLEQPDDESVLTFPAWEWADWDRDRLVWVETGCIRAARLGAHKLGRIRTLHDFNTDAASC